MAACPKSQRHEVKKPILKCTELASNGTSNHITGEGRPTHLYTFINGPPIHCWPAPSESDPARLWEAVRPPHHSPGTYLQTCGNRLAELVCQGTGRTLLFIREDVTHVIEARESENFTTATQRTLRPSS